MQKNIPAKPKTALKAKIILIISGLFLFLVLIEIGLLLGGLSCYPFKNIGTYKPCFFYKSLNHTEDENIIIVSRKRPGRLF